MPPFAKREAPDPMMTILRDQALRVNYFKRDFKRFCLYYFPHYHLCESPDFHDDWDEGFESDDNLFFKGFRGSAKTTKLTMFYAYCIAYKKGHFITHYCFALDASEAFLYDLVVELQTNARLLEDFGSLYPETWGKKDKKEKAGVSEFVTTNGIRVKAMSVGKSPRGLLFKTADGAFRPDIVGIDDVDTLKTVANQKTIEKSYSFIKNEIVGGIGRNARIFFLGNVIKTDGVVPRMERDCRASKRWRVYSQAIYDEEGRIVWPERFCETEEESLETGKESLAKIREESGSTAWAQNYLLVPATAGETVIRREHIRYGTVVAKRIVIGVDPAFSKKNLSDAFAIAVSGHASDGRKDIRAVYALQGEAKDYEKAVNFIYKLYKETGASVVHFESVAFQTVLAQMLRAKGVAVKEIRPHADKVTRLSEHQPDFEAGKILFDPEWPGIKEAVDELLEFPGGIHDDRVDAMVYSLQKYAHFDVYIW